MGILDRKNFTNIYVEKNVQDIQRTCSIVVILFF